MPLDNTDWAADQWLSRIPTDALVAELRKRYCGELAILDYIEMIECELMALKKAKEGNKDGT